jgi:hypothetical protein
MCGGGGPPPPDPRVGQATLEEVQLAREMWHAYMAPGGDRDWQRGITSEALGIFRRSDQRAGEQQAYQLEQSRKNDARYWGTAVPYEDRLIKQVEDQDSEAFREAQVTRALADTQRQVDSSRQQGIREMTRRGASPESGAYAAMMNDGGRAQAMAMATAANKTRLAAQQVGLSNKMQMYGGMKGLAGLGATSAQLALGAGGQALNAAGGMSNAAQGSINANNATYAARTQGVNTGIQGYNNYYGNIVAGVNAANQGDQTGQILGTVAGIAGYALMASDRRLKTDIKRIGKLESGLNVYRYRYKAGGPTTVGVMADEVKKKAPEAYVKGGAGGGYDAVDYSKL